MARLQLALDVDDIEAATAFYTALLGVAPAKTRPGYANFAVADPPLKLVLLENPGRGGSLNHLGIEVESVAAVDREQRRLAELGLAGREERGTTCCYARQDKFWLRDTPSGERWEVYTVLADSTTYGPAEAAQAQQRADDTTEDSADAGVAACCEPACCAPGEDRATVSR